MLIRVLNILEEGRYGGPQKRVLEVGKALVPHDVETIVVLPKTNSEIFVEKLNNARIGYRSFRLRRMTKNMGGALQYVVSFIPELISLTRFIRSQKPCVVHTNGAYQIKGIIAAYFSGVRSVWHLNDTYAPGMIKSLFKVVRNKYGDTFLAAAQRSKQYYLHDYPNAHSVRVLNEPVDCNHFTPGNRIPLGEKAEISIVTIGNISPVKGLDIFIDMAIWLKDKTKARLKFNIVGKMLDNQRDYIEKLKATIANADIDIHFQGEQNDVKLFLQEADIYICSSRYESSPMAVWEAMSMALPVVATDVGDIQAIFQKYDCGLVCETENATALGQHVISIIEDPMLAKRLGQKAREVVKAKFDLQHCVAGHLQHYKSIWKK